MTADRPTESTQELPQDLPDASPQPRPEDSPPVPAETLAVPGEGLEGATSRKRRVVIVGAGLAGLAAGFELKRQGHQVVILEAQNRVGGRIHTLRSFAPGLYAEAGGMRIPRVHDLTLRYCQVFGLPMRPFVMGNPKGLVHVGGVRMTAQEANADPSRLGFRLAETERGRTSEQLWEQAIGELREMVQREGDAAWDHIVREYDQFSLYEYLRHRGWSSGAIEYFAVMNFLESDMHNALVEVLREELGGAYVDMQEIAGGMDRLPAAFFGSLQQEIRLGAEVYALDQDPDGVAVHVRTEARRSVERADFAIVTIPFSVLRHVEVITPFSREKQRAIRQLNYHASTKILFQVRERIWETDDEIMGGASVTDMPIRRLNYPTPDPEQPARHAAGLLHLGPGRAAMGRHGRGDAPGRGAGRRGAYPPAHPRGVRGRSFVRLVLRSVGTGSLRHVRAGAADAAPGRHRQARGSGPLRGRALLAVPRLDPGSAGVWHPRRAARPRGAGRGRGCGVGWVRLSGRPLPAS